MNPYGFEALGTHWWLEIWDEVSEDTRGAAYGRAARLAKAFNNRYSRFLPDSEISVLNRERILTNPSPETRALLQYGVDLFRRTKGTFNFLTGHILEARGYDKDYSFTDKGSAELVPGNPTTDLIFSEDKIELRFGNVDLGGYGKGWCIDLIANFFRDELGIEQFLINGGGDMFVTHQGGEAVEIYLQDAFDPQKIVGSTFIKNRGFAASSPHQRSWSSKLQNGAIAQQTHIVGTVSQDIVYITAPTATDADAFATTLLQVDADTARQFAADNDLTIL